MSMRNEHGQRYMYDKSNQYENKRLYQKKKS